METALSTTSFASESEHNVFSESFVCSGIMNQFRRSGYKVQAGVGINLSGKPVRIITASTFFRKEIIEVKGCKLEAGSSGQLDQLNHREKLGSKQSLTDAILNSFVSVGNYYRDENMVISIAVPNVPRFRAIVNRLQGYFTNNDLYFKVYLVNENGGVEVFYLNEQSPRK